MFGSLQDDCMISKLIGLALGKILAQIIGYNCYLHLFGNAKPSSGLEILELDLKTLLCNLNQLCMLTSPFLVQRPRFLFLLSIMELPSKHESFLRPLKAAKFVCQYLMFCTGYFWVICWNKLPLLLLRKSLDVKLRHLLISGFRFPQRCFGYRFSDHKLDKCTNLEDKFFLEGYALFWMNVLIIINKFQKKKTYCIDDSDEIESLVEVKFFLKGLDPYTEVQPKRRTSSLGLKIGYNSGKGYSNLGRIFCHGGSSKDKKRFVLCLIAMRNKKVEVGQGAQKTTKLVS